MIRTILASFLVLVSLLPAAAHPHVFVTARSEVIYDASGAVTAIRHAWTFDDVFAAFATQGLDTNRDGIYSREELQSLAKTNVESLHEYDFFTFAKISGKKILLQQPIDYFLDYTDKHLTLHFTLPLIAPQRLGEQAFALEIYDPTYFVAFDMAEGNPVTLASAPAGCVVSVHRASEPDPALAEQLKVDSFAMAQEGIGAKFSNRILVNCP